MGILSHEQPEDTNLIREWLHYLETERLDYTLSFRNLAGLVTNDTANGFFSKNRSLVRFLSVVAPKYILLI
jgi:hypothetical protein